MIWEKFWCQVVVGGSRMARLLQDENCRENIIEWVQRKQCTFKSILAQYKPKHSQTIDVQKCKESKQKVKIQASTFRITIFE